MITINKNPYICSFSKNSIDFEVQTNMYFKSIFVYPSIEIEILDLPAIGDHFAIKWTNPETFENEEVRLITVNGSVAANYNELWEIPDTNLGSFLGITTLLRNIILPKLQATPLLNGYFDIVAVGDTKILLTARQAVSELVPIWETNQAAANIVADIQADFVLPDSREGYDMRALVYFENEYLSGEFEMVANLQCVIDNNSIAVLDLSETLNAEIENGWNEYPVPYTQPTLYKSTNLKRYYVKFVESWIGEVETFNTVSDVQFVHWGGVSTDDSMMGDAVSLITNGNNFLTWWPSGKRIGKSQDDWLGWMNLYKDTTFEIVVTITADGYVYEDVWNTVVLKKFETVVFNSGFDGNDLQAFVPGLTVQKWSWRIKPVGESPISEEFTYYFDTACLRKVLLYFNSFGVPETFHTSGEWQETMNVSTSIASRSAVFGLSALFPQTFVFDSKHTNSMKAVTGMLEKLEAQRLQSMINSMIAYVLDDNRWVPVVLNTGKTPVLKINEFVTQIELEVLKANENDRASFFDLQPDIDIITTLRIERIEVIHNNLDITTYSNFLCYKEDVLVATFTWNAGLGYYTPSTSVSAAGNYRFKGSLSTASENYAITKHLKYSLKTVFASFFGTGLIQIKLKIDNANDAPVIIDWGDGVTTTNTIGSTLTTIPHTFTATGKKVIRLSKLHFFDVIEFYTSYDLGKIDFGAFVNLQKITYVNGPSGNWYLSHLQKLQYVYFNNTEVSNLEIGFQKDLTYLKLKDTNIGSDALDALILELWKFRKLYGAAVTFLLEGLGYTESSVFTSISAGTGDYAGEGLVANYGWTINIS